MYTSFRCVALKSDFLSAVKGSSGVTQLLSGHNSKYSREALVLSPMATFNPRRMTPIGKEWQYLEYSSLQNSTGNFKTH